MTYYATNSYGSNVYSVKVPADIDNVVFSSGNNSNITVTVKEGIADGIGFYPTKQNTSKQWLVGTYEIGGMDIPPYVQFEFEIDMLLQMQKLGMEYKEVKIKTIKVENHRPLHFHPVRDSFRIYMLIFKFAASSLLCTGVDLLAFYLLTKFLTPFLMFASITLCTFVARAISSFLNYSINKKAVFKDQKIPKYTLLRFYSIAIPQACLSAIFVQFLTSLFSADYAIIKTLLKMIVDTSLFFLSFQLQRKWVFKNKK